MYIPYEKIGESAALFLPVGVRESVRSFFHNLKVEQNCRYIAPNKQKMLEKLRKKVKSEKIRVAYLCFSKQKWKCESLYKLMLEDENFHPFILVSKDSTSPKKMAGSGCSSSADVRDVYKFFTDKQMETYYAYDCENEIHLPLNTFEPDIIFYQEPWYVETSQGPVVTSAFALSAYVPYFVANVASIVEYDLRFHLYIQKHYILNELVQKFYSERMRNKGENLIVTGHTALDYFYLGKDKGQEKKYVIYAPHWSINYERENYATFEWNGAHILEFAKAHPELNWIFKPHPSLKERLRLQNIMTREEIQSYWDDWEKIGLKYESGDYLDLFAQSYAMITDCGSFLTEFFLTEQPVIHLISEKAFGYNPSAEAVVKNYYKAHNIDELDKLFEEILIQKTDSMKQQRVNAISDLGFNGVYAAQNILDDLKTELKIR